MLLTIAFLGLSAALVQIGPLSLLTIDPLAAPLLPVALVAGWAAVREPGETWPALLLAPVVMGTVSQERVGVFVLAFLPAAVLATLTRRLDRDPSGSATRRIAAAALAAAAAVPCYDLLLAVSGGHPRSLVDESNALLAASALTALLATGVALLVWRSRPRPRGLFE